MNNQYTVDNDIIKHLIFHKSLIDDKVDNSSRINYYIDLLQKTNEGEHIAIDNPFDRSIAIAFELVINHQLNPWDIDLVKFSTMYIKRAKEEKIDLITAGRIIYMAWKVLKLQSDDLVVALGSEEKYEPFDWGDIPQEMYFTKDDPYSYVNLLIKSPEPPLDLPIRRDAKRKVTLIELLDAFDKARRESEEYQLIEKNRQEERERLAILARERMKGTAHEDHLEKDIQEVWDRIRSMPKKIMTLKELCSGLGKEEVIKVFMSILFLAYHNKIIVYQKDFPYGKIFIKNIGYS